MQSASLEVIEEFIRRLRPPRPVGGVHALMPTVYVWPEGSYDICSNPDGTPRVFHAVGRLNLPGCNVGIGHTIYNPAVLSFVPLRPFDAYVFSMLDLADPSFPAAPVTGSSGES